MEAIGLIEVIGLVAGIESADACAKAANIKIIGLKKVGSGIVTLSISGDVGAVRAAIEAGVEAVLKIGTLRSSHIIPRISKEVALILEGKPSKPKEEPQEPKVEHQEQKEELKEVEEIIEEVEEILEEEIVEEEALPKYSIKELKSMVKKLKPEITYKELNNFKKAELIELIKDLSGEDK